MCRAAFIRQGGLHNILLLIELADHLNARKPLTYTCTNYRLACSMKDASESSVSSEDCLNTSPKDRKNKNINENVRRALIVHTERRQLLHGTNSAAPASLLFRASYLPEITGVKVVGLCNFVHAIFVPIKSNKIWAGSKWPLFCCQQRRKAFKLVACGVSSFCLLKDYLFAATLGCLALPLFLPLSG